MAWETWTLGSLLWPSSRNSQLWATGTTIVSVVAAAWYAFRRRRRSTFASQDLHTRHTNSAPPTNDSELLASHPQVGSQDAVERHSDRNQDRFFKRKSRKPGVNAFQSAPPCITVDDLDGSSPTSLPCRRPRSLQLGQLATPSSSSSNAAKKVLTPGTPQPERCDLKIITGDVGAILFDFDGTLTATPGDRAKRSQKESELRERTPLLKPRLEKLREAGITLGIISKSSDATITNALQNTGLRVLFNGPVLAKAVGLEGKAGFIENLCKQGELAHLSKNRTPGWHRVVLVDDDVRELDRARGRGIQTYAAPKEGGLQEEDFDEIFQGVGLGSPANSVKTSD